MIKRLHALDDKYNISMRIAWLFIVLTFVWIIAKAMGFINTSVWVEVFPYLGSVVPLAVFFIQMGSVLEMVKSNTRAIRKLANTMQSNHTDVCKRMDRFDSRMDTFDSKMDTLQDKVHSIDKRVSVIDMRVSALESKA